MRNALDFVRGEDIFVVTKLDRLARSVMDLSNIMQLLEEKKDDLVVLEQGIDTTNIYGKLQFNILVANLSPFPPQFLILPLGNHLLVTGSHVLQRSRGEAPTALSLG
ncbi:MAG: recombinase family protein [Desulfuromonadales bacterium]